MMNIVRHFRAVVLVFLLCCAEFATAVTFRSQELKALAGRAGISTTGLSEGYNFMQVGGRRVYVRVLGGRIDNIGYDIFSDMLRRDGTQRVLTDFLERYFLLLNYPPADHTVKHMLRDDRFKFVHGSMATVATLHPGDGFGYSTDDKIYVATWTRSGQELLTVTFPMEYQLLLGVSKSEAEDGFEYELTRQQLREWQVAEPDVATLTPSAQPFYYTHEGGWYLRKNISSSTYYCRKSDQRYRLVNDVSHPAETAANMMLSGDVSGDYQMDVTQILYGFKNKQFSVPLRQWIAHCEATGCTLYFGIESVDYDEVCASVFAVNEHEYYNHVMSVVIPLSVIDNRQGTIKARLHTYVPMHNALMLTRNHKIERAKNKKIYE